MQGTPVKSCMITRAGVNWISVSGSASASQPPRARMWSAVMLAPSSVRSRFSSSTLRLYGRSRCPRPRRAGRSRSRVPDLEPSVCTEAVRARVLSPRLLILTSRYLTTPGACSVEPGLERQPSMSFATSRCREPRRSSHSRLARCGISASRSRSGPRGRRRATHSTWWVIGKASKARSASAGSPRRARYAMSAPARRGRRRRRRPPRGRSAAMSPRSRAAGAGTRRVEDDQVGADLLPYQRLRSTRSTRPRRDSTCGRGRMLAGIPSTAAARCRTRRRAPTRTARPRRPGPPRTARHPHTGRAPAPPARGAAPPARESTKVAGGSRVDLPEPAGRRAGTPPTTSGVVRPARSRRVGHASRPGSGDHGRRRPARRRRPRRPPVARRSSACSSTPLLDDPLGRRCRQSVDGDDRRGTGAVAARHAPGVDGELDPRPPAAAPSRRRAALPRSTGSHLDVQASASRWNCSATTAALSCRWYARSTCWKSQPPQRPGPAYGHGGSTRCGRGLEHLDRVARAGTGCPPRPR